jgi:hypothetical protein
MPAVSKAQQRLMGMAYAVKKGDMPKSEASKEVLDLADSMTLQQLKDFASTSHENLPEKNSKELDEYSLGSYFTGSFLWFTQAAQAAVQKIAMSQDERDPLIQRFLNYIKDSKENEKVDEGDYGAGVSANPSGVPGMGNAVPPTADQTGSGDIFGVDDEEDPNRKVGIMGYEQYKKWLRKWQQNQEKDQKAQASKKES